MNRARISTTKLLGAFGLALMAACAGTPQTPIANVARGDLGCDQAVVKEVADNRYEAQGCGRTATYAQLCSGRHCSWVRVRSPNEVQTAGGATPSYAQRQIIPAPPPQQREIIQAPPPEQPKPREIIQAPPPEASTNPQPPSSDATATSDPNGATAVAAAPTAQATPLAQGDLTQPYQTEVPTTAVAQRVEYPPPAPLVETQPVMPAPNYQWINGYWWWANPSWTWVPGYWCAPRFGYSYVPSSWYFASGYWYWGPGGWARPNSTLIIAGVGARPTRYVYSRSFTPYRGAVAAGPGGRIGVTSSMPARAPARYTPTQSPMYHYPASTVRPTRMGAMRASPSGFQGGLSAPSRYSSGTRAPATRYNGGFNGGSTFNNGSSPMRMGSSPSSSSVRSAPMTRMPSGGGGGSSFSRGGGGMGRMGGGGGGGSVGRMGGGGGAPHASPGRR